MLFFKVKKAKKQKKNTMRINGKLITAMIAVMAFVTIISVISDNPVMANTLTVQSEQGCIGYGVVTASSLNVRRSASTTAPILGKLSKGTRVKIGFEKNNWFNIFYGTNGGWVSADYINFNEPISSKQKKGFKNAAFNNSSQVITVTNNTKGSKYATVNAYEKVNGQWNLVYSDMNSIIGKNGMEYDSNRRQSTNTTPAGIYNIPLAFGWAGNPGTKIPFRTPDNNSYWNLNSGSSTYNRWIQWNPGGDYEHLKTERLYKYALVLDYNWSQKPGKGGAIFIHLNPNFYTGGCVGLGESNLVKIMKWLNPSKNPKVLICPQGDLNKYYY